MALFHTALAVILMVLSLLLKFDGSVDSAIYAAILSTWNVVFAHHYLGRD